MPAPQRPLDPNRSPRDALGAALREYRTSRGLSQAALARQVHVSASLIARIEKAERVATASVLDACDASLGAGGVLSALWRVAAAERPRDPRRPAACKALICHAEAAAPPSCIGTGPR